MNFGWNINVSGSNGLDTALHEIGHAIGFHHEHQNPNAGIVWNEDAVYDYFARTQTPPWDKAKTDHNILNKIDPLTVDGSDWDPNSIMHYSFRRGLIREPVRYQTPEPGAGTRLVGQGQRGGAAAVSGHRRCGAGAQAVAVGAIVDRARANRRTSIFCPQPAGTTTSGHSVNQTR